MVKIDLVLTKRQRDVLDLYLKEELSQQAIAEKIGTIQPRVSECLQTISRKLGYDVRLIKKNTKFVRYAIELEKNP